jgi:16S rRNA (adenine1518-N6/adenine1519-N6)-dimethyltransferase
MARQRLGQHFLADPGWREEIARAIRISPQSIAPSAISTISQDSASCWIEIGAGHGEITPLLAATGVPVYAIELDRMLIGHLQKVRREYPNLTVVHGDILEVDISAIAGGRRARIYGNLPYYITSPILHRLFESAELIDEMHFVIQAEVAERLIAQPGNKAYGYLSVLTQFYARPELVLRIPPGAFRPPPDVSSALVTLRLSGEQARLGSVDASRFLEFVKLCFSQKRKTLVNSLRTAVDPQRVRDALASLNIRSDARAEQLSIQALAALYQELHSN